MKNIFMILTVATTSFALHGMNLQDIVKIDRAFIALGANSLCIKKPNTNGLYLPNGPYPIHYAAINGETEQIKKFFKDKQDIDLVSINQETPLMAAIRFEQIEAAKCLIDLGANICYRNKLNHTPLLFAQKKLEETKNILWEEFIAIMISLGAN